MTRLPPLFVLCLLGCFNPDPTHYTIKCDQYNPCPGDQICASSLCVPAASASADLGMVQDLAGVDQAGGGSGCSQGGGIPLGRAWACPGLIAKGTLRSRCKTGFSVCSNANAVDLGACRAQSGFFIGNVPAKKQNLGPAEDAVCGAAATGFESALWFGCGRIAASDRTVNAKNTCSGFVQALDCQGTPWDCSTGSGLDQTANTGAPEDGVLCCQP